MVDSFHYSEPSTSVQEPSKKRLFKSPMKSWYFIFPNGSRAVFRQGQYATDKEYEIEHLVREVKEGHPQIFVDPKELYLDPAKDDPIASLRARIALEERAKILKEMQEATDPDRDLGEYKQGKLNAASTSDIAPVTAGGDAGARLVALQKSLGIGK